MTVFGCKQVRCTYLTASGEPVKRSNTTTSVTDMFVATAYMELCSYSMRKNQQWREFSEVQKPLP